MLQACHDLHGADGFDYVPLKTWPPEEVHARELEAIATLKPDLNIYGNDKIKARRRGAAADPATHEIDGEWLTIEQISERFDVGVETVRKRIQRGMTGKDLGAAPHAAPRKQYVRRK